jgi:hypothetical protein
MGKGCCWSIDILSVIIDLLVNQRSEKQKREQLSRQRIALTD